MTNKIEWHAHADTYPLLEGEEYESFKADIGVKGVLDPIIFRQVNGTKQYLDGRNRARAAGELKINCPERRVDVADTDVVAFIDSCNLHRRHLTAEQRRVRVKVMHEDGASLRAIATTLGIDRKTVRTDLEEIKDKKSADLPQVVQFPPPEHKGTVPQPSGGVRAADGRIPSSDQVVGKDGKIYPKYANKGAVCRKHRLEGKTEPVKGCKDCTPAKKVKPGREPGDDTETENAERKAKRDNGKPVFDDRKINDLIGKLTRLFDDRSRAFGKGKMHQACIDAMSTVNKRWTEWQKAR